MTTVYVIIGAVVVLLIVLLVIYNQLVMLRNKVNEAFSTMDVFLKKRFDLIPSLVEVVKGYARHETDVLQQVTRQRTATSHDDRSGLLAGEAKIGDVSQKIHCIQ